MIETMTLQQLEKTLTEICGQEIEIIIRAERKFTYFFEGRCDAAVKKLKDYFSNIGSFEELDPAYDEESDCTVLYHNV